MAIENGWISSEPWEAGRESTGLNGDRRAKILLLRTSGGKVGNGRIRKVEQQDMIIQ